MGALAAPGDGHVRVHRGAGLEEVPDVVWMGDPRLLRARELVDQPPVEFGTPALVHEVPEAAALAVDETILPEQPLAVLVLVVRQPEGRLGGEADIRRHTQAAGPGAPTGLGGDHDGAVGRARAVEGRGVGALEHAERLDVRRIDVLDRVTVVDPAVSEVPRAAPVGGRGVVERDPVHDKEGLVLAGNRARAPDHDPRGTPGGAGVRDVDARHVALERVDQVRLRHLGQLIAREVLDRVAEGPFLTFDAESGDHDAFEPDGRDRHHDIHLVGYGRFLGPVPDIGEDQGLGILGHAQGEVPPAVCHRGDHGSFHGDPGARKRLLRLLHRHGPGHRAHLLGAQRRGPQQKDGEEKQACQWKTFHEVAPSRLDGENC